MRYLPKDTEVRMLGALIVAVFAVSAAIVAMWIVTIVYPNDDSRTGERDQ